MALTEFGVKNAIGIESDATRAWRSEERFKDSPFEQTNGKSCVSAVRRPPRFGTNTEDGITITLC